jgi:Putative Ig domain
MSIDRNVSLWACLSLATCVSVLAHGQVAHSSQSNVILPVATTVEEAPPFPSQTISQIDKTKLLRSHGNTPQKAEFDQSLVDPQLPTERANLMLKRGPEKDFLATDLDSVPAVLTSPTPGTKLSGSSVTFTWTAGTSGTTGYWMWIGTTPGSFDIANLGQFSGTSTTTTLPTGGATIYIRLWTVINGTTYLYNDYSYTESGAPVPAVLTSPTPGTKLSGSSVTFTWTAGTSGTTGYWMWIGTTPGSFDIANLGQFSGTSTTTTLPTGGATIYIRLWTVINGTTYLYNDYSYTENGTPAPVITSATTASGTVGTAFSYQITATNSPTSYGASGLPSGLSVNGTTGRISGTPTASSASTVTLTATNSGGTGTAPLTLTITGGTVPLTPHTIQISNDADDGYFKAGSGWYMTPQNNGADLVGSWDDTRLNWVTGYRFPSTGINSGDAIRSAYLRLVSTVYSASSATCGSEPCTNTNYTFRVYGVAQDDGGAFSGMAGNTPLDVPYTTAHTDYTTTGPGDVHGSCQGNNNGQNTCTHIIDVTNIVKEITSRPGWTSTSSIRFVMLSTDDAAPNAYAGYEDYSDNPSKAASLLVNPPVPTVVSSGAWGTDSNTTYPTTYPIGPFVYPGASTLLLFLGDYYNFFNLPVSQPSVSDSCGNTWNILAGPTNWAGISYYMRSTVYYVQNPVSCPAGDTITITVNPQEPIFTHFLAIAGSDTGQPPVASAITSPNPGTYTANAISDPVTLTNSGLLVSWIFGDSDAPHTFTPQTGIVDLNSTPTYLPTVTESVSSPGSYQSEFSISPSPDGWQVVIIGLPAPHQ